MKTATITSKKIIIKRPTREDVQEMATKMKEYESTAWPATVTRLDEDANLCQSLYKAVFNDFSIVLFYANDKAIEILASAEVMKDIYNLSYEEKYVFFAEILIGFQNHLDNTASYSMKGISVDIVRCYKTTDGELHESKDRALAIQRGLDVKEKLRKFADERFYNNMLQSDFEELLWSYEEELMEIFKTGR